MDYDNFIAGKEQFKLILILVYVVFKYAFI